MKEKVIYSDMEYEVSTKTLDPILWAAAYHKGYRAPNYPVPAIKFAPAFESCVGEVPSAIVIYSCRLCEHCDGYHMRVEAVWEFNEEVCIDWFFPVGTYTNRRELELGKAARDFIKANKVLIQ